MTGEYLIMPGDREVLQNFALIRPDQHDQSLVCYVQQWSFNICVHFAYMLMHIHTSPIHGFGHT